MSERTVLMRKRGITYEAAKPEEPYGICVIEVSARFAKWRLAFEIVRGLLRGDVRLFGGDLPLFRRKP